MSGQLARVRWELGQTLLPEHFEAQEGALREEAALRSRLHGLPAYGVAALRWNDTLLREGVVSILSATLVMPSGQLLEVPGNAAVASLNLNVPGTGTVTAFLHLLQEPAPEGSDQLGGASVVTRLRHQLVLSADQNLPGAVSTLKLAELRKAPDGSWQMSPGYLPPLLLVGASPFLQAELEQLQPALEAFQHKLMMDAVSYLSGSGLHAVRQCLKSVFRMQRLLANLKSQVHLHPCQLYEALKEFYVEVCFYHDSAPQHAGEPYNHEQLAPCFRRLFQPLFEQMRTAQKDSPHAPFVVRDGVYRIELPANAKKAKDVYFLIQKSQAHRAVALQEFKLAGPNRLLMSHRLSLPGIGIKRIDRPIMAHAFGPEVEFYLLQPGDEWQHAVAEGAVAFYNRPEFGDLEFYLYWSMG
jgi:type VI secretion system protein ImpJ